MKWYKLTEALIDNLLAEYKTILLKEKGTLEITEPLPKAVLKFSTTAWYKMTTLVKKCDKEVAWHGLVTRGECPGEFIVSDVILFPQVVTGATVTSDEAKYTNWILLKDDATFAKMRMHGHSHVNMLTNPSGVDTTYQKQLLDNGVDDFYIFLITNKRKEIWVNIYDVANNIIYETKDVTVVGDPELEYTPWVEENIGLYVTEPSTEVHDYKYWADRYKQRKKKEKTEAEEAEYEKMNYTDKLLYDLNSPDDGEFDYYGSIDPTFGYQE